jgi:hypothetical protein
VTIFAFWASALREQLTHLARLCQQLMWNDNFRDDLGSHVALMGCAWFLLVFLLICVTSIYSGMWLVCGRGVSAVSGALAPGSCKQGCGRGAHQLSKQAHAPRPCLSPDHKPLEALKQPLQLRCGDFAPCSLVTKQPPRGHPNMIFQLRHRY